MNKLAFIASCLFLLSNEVSGFGVSISGTRCNTDRQKGEITNPCGSLYDAVCSGSYCECPRGYKEDSNLQRCVRGDPDDEDDSQNGGSDLFEDLPFDFDPNSGGQSDPLSPSRGFAGITATRCSASHNPCSSFYQAVCYGGHCACPSGTVENRDLSRCESLPPRRQQEEEDEDNDIVIRLFSGSQGLAGNSGVVSLVCIIVTIFGAIN